MREIERRHWILGSIAALVGCRAPESGLASEDATAHSTPTDPSPSAISPSAFTAAKESRDETYPLFDAFPSLATRLPRTRLGRFPSRVEEVPALARALGLASLHVKRDDGVALRFGGGKVRKLELYFADAALRGCKTIITSGGVGSNQAVATALLGRDLGFAVRLFLAPQPKSSLVDRNLRALGASGAEVTLFGSVSESEKEAERQAKIPGRSAPTYVVSAGGSTALGTLGFVSGGLEIAAAVKRGELPSPARIYVALGLGGSAAGIALGCALGGLSSEVVAVRASNPQTVSLGKVHAMAAEALVYLRALDATFPRDVATNLRIDPRFVGPGYGTPTPAGDAAILRARREAGWELDAVYTGKAFAALLADAPRAKGPCLFWNTQSSRPLELGPIPLGFERFVEGT